MTMYRVSLFLFVSMSLTGIGTNGAFGDEADSFPSQIRPLLEKHCIECHGPEKSKGDFRLRDLTPDFDDARNREKWLAVLDRVATGEMPPKGKPALSENETRALTTWIRAAVRLAEAKERASKGRVPLRRLNRVEYQNTIQDLLGITVDVTDLLPEDGQAHGFDNVAEGQHVSSFLIERYLEAAERALNLAIANGPQPPLIKERYDLNEERHVRRTTERVFRKQDDALVCFCSSAWQAVILRQFYPRDRGRYRYRIAVSAVQSDDKPVTFRVDAGQMLMATKSRLVGYFDAPSDEVAVIEFVEDQEARSTIRILPYGLASAQAVNKVGAENWKEPGLALHWIEVEGPLHDSWPPESHTRIFGELAQTKDAAGILRTFARRAFRRSVTDADIAIPLRLVKAKLDAGRSFEQAIRVGLTAIMVSSDFLFLREKPGHLDDFALASRLSYFLWSTMPDETLLTLAEQGKLSEPETLRAQVERMLNDPKATRFSENFVGQWLGLREIDATEPSHILYPEYDHLLKVSMIRETELFFTELLKHDLSLTNIVSSDFAMLNGRLAKHYGIPGIDGWEFQRVTLPSGTHRGGVLTQASVLKVTANGTVTSPVLRGAWVLDRILGTPPPRPPADIPAIEPDTRGSTTIREQLARHRADSSCATCHAEIDPPGFALESFDVIGGWREHYRTTGRGEAVLIDGQRMRYLRGPKVDPSSEMPDGATFTDIDEFKQLLLRDRDQLARGFIEKLVTYATGAAPAEADRPEINAIINRVRQKDFGLRTLIHEIVQSDLFQEK